jgi:hypothetical protein
MRRRIRLSTCAWPSEGTGSQESRCLSRPPDTICDRRDTRRPGAFEALQRLADAGVLVRRNHAIPAIVRLDPGVRAHLQELARNTLQPAELSALLWRTTALMERELDSQQRKATPRPRQPFGYALWEVFS